MLDALRDVREDSLFGPGFHTPDRVRFVDDGDLREGLEVGGDSHGRRLGNRHRGPLADDLAYLVGDAVSRVYLAYLVAGELLARLGDVPGCDTERRPVAREDVGVPLVLAVDPRQVPQHVVGPLADVDVAVGRVETDRSFEPVRVRRHRLRI